MTDGARDGGRHARSGAYNRTSAKCPRRRGRAPKSFPDYMGAMVETADTDWIADAEARLLAGAIGASERHLWGEGLYRTALARAGLTPAEGALVAPEGARDLVALLFARHDAEAMKALEGYDPSALKIRERIFTGVRERVAAALLDPAATRRAGLFLALPPNAPLGARLAWRSADLIWRWAGDTATDENHYSKRAILSGVLLSTIAVRLARGPEAAEAALRRRIDDVMQFEKLKARLPDTSAALTAAAARLGRIRYGLRSGPRAD